MRLQPDIGGGGQCGDVSDARNKPQYRIPAEPNIRQRQAIAAVEVIRQPVKTVDAGLRVGRHGRALLRETDARGCARVPVALKNAARCDRPSLP